MRIAIYSRGIEAEQQADVQQLLNELADAQVETVLFQPFHEKIREVMVFPPLFLSLIHISEPTRH